MVSIAKCPLLSLPIMMLTRIPESFAENLSAITCLFEALANLRNLFSSIDEAYNAALAYVLTSH